MLRGVAASRFVCNRLKERSRLRSSWNTDPFLLCDNSKGIEFDGHGSFEVTDGPDTGSELAKEAFTEAAGGTLGSGWLWKALSLE